jgi:hypothetical protein
MLQRAGFAVAEILGPTGYTTSRYTEAVYVRASTSGSATVALTAAPPAAPRPRG